MSIQRGYEIINGPNTIPFYMAFLKTCFAPAQGFLNAFCYYLFRTFDFNEKLSGIAYNPRLEEVRKQTKQMATLFLTPEDASFQQKKAISPVTANHRYSMTLPSKQSLSHHRQEPNLHRISVSMNLQQQQLKRSSGHFVPPISTTSITPPSLSSSPSKPPAQRNSMIIRNNSHGNGSSSPTKHALNRSSVILGGSSLAPKSPVGRLQASPKSSGSSPLRLSMMPPPSP